MMNRKLMKNGLALGLALSLCLALGGCFNSATQPAEIPDETLVPIVTTEPLSTIAPLQSPDGQPWDETVAAPFDWAQNGTSVENRVKLFSEVADCRIVTSEQTALVGVKFTASYKGELTQRIRDMIAGEIMGSDPAITVVAVTQDPADYARIETLAQRKAEGTSDAEIKPEVDQIAKNAGTMR